ncbi:MAG: VWA domain-containing protein [Actinomyces ruminicola]|uniref:Ca-activated chloride channel family protein n=1 Tax=Actinomyces ruminicola TaxID=332524 RepID=A0A1G9RXD6_9ACTO|nr:VWA domain-containing protein [Actinomyces ruminicola]MBE6482288.1 VWA domain-containing protein [Actinomyces ruminicola]SDM27881.1 Ca-activated chloride channel family protein [Actinomyces ruminicola]
MRLVPLFGWPLTLAVVLVVVAALAVSARWLLRPAGDPGARTAWWRRVALGAVMVLILAGPSLPVTEAVAVSNVEIYLVVDRTGSMAAEDWAGGPDAGGGTRLDGVRGDLAAIRDAYPDARFSIIALDSAAARELPLTRDTDAVSSWIGALQQEVTDRSKGSSLERALPLLAQVLTTAAEAASENARLVYILSDGEATDDGAGADAAAAAGVSWEQLAAVVDGGAVLGYGTESGGSMRAFDGSGAEADYIADPDTGEPAVSVPDTAELQAVADALGIAYLQRTGTDDQPTTAFTDQNVDQVLSDGRERKRHTRYLTWPLGLVAAGLLIWEGAALIRADRAVRELTRPAVAARAGNQAGGPI